MISPTLPLTLGAGIVGGAFFAFSTFVMRALKRVGPAEGIRAMQEINITVINPWFLGVFLGTAAVSVFFGLRSAMHLDEPGSTLALAGCILYFVGTFGVTLLLNVPLNDALAKLAPDAIGAAAAWDHYVATWTAWNHVRTAAALVAAALWAYR